MNTSKAYEKIVSDRYNAGYTGYCTELKPTDCHKSFYGKAKVYETKDGVKVLRSYSTDVMAIANDKVIKLWDGWSATTGRHIHSFATAFANYTKLNKGIWERMTVGKEYATDYLDFIGKKFARV